MRFVRAAPRSEAPALAMASSWPLAAWSLDPPPQAVSKSASHVCAARQARRLWNGIIGWEVVGDRLAWARTESRHIDGRQKPALEMGEGSDQKPLVSPTVVARPALHARAHTSWGLILQYRPVDGRIEQAFVTTRFYRARLTTVLRLPRPHPVLMTGGALQLQQLVRLHHLRLKTTSGCPCQN